MATHLAVCRRSAALAAAAILLMVGTTASAAIVPTVPLATSANYAVLGGSKVTNTGNSALDGSLGLWPGSAITGFPPGKVLPLGTTDTTNAAAHQAQSDLTAAYVDAAGRPITATTTPDLLNVNLKAGVYAGPSTPLLLGGALTLDGAGDRSSVFIFQTDSTLRARPRTLSGSGRSGIEVVPSQGRPARRCPSPGSPQITYSARQLYTLLRNVVKSGNQARFYRSVPPLIPHC